jgi:predicted nuclease with TOPRIM domain
MAWIQNSDDKRAAAEYLVEQMRILNEEKQGLIFDNQNISSQMNELQFEYEKNQREFKDFQCFTSGQEYSQENVAQNTQRLVQRVEELEDLVIELKSKQSAGEIVEMKQLISQLQLDA